MIRESAVLFKKGSFECSQKLNLVTLSENNGTGDKDKFKYAKKTITITILNVISLSLMLARLNRTPFTLLKSLAKSFLKKINEIKVEIKKQNNTKVE